NCLRRGSQRSDLMRFVAMVGGSPVRRSDDIVAREQMAAATLPAGVARKPEPAVVHVAGNVVWARTAQAERAWIVGGKARGSTLLGGLVEQFVQCGIGLIENGALRSRQSALSHLGPPMFVWIGFLNHLFYENH